MEDPEAVLASARRTRMNGTANAEEERRRIENLRAVMAGPPVPVTPQPATGRGAPGEPRSHRARSSGLAALAAGALFLLGKLKFLGLLVGVLKFKTLATMLLSTAMYASGWGWPFAVGFVLLIFVHELGHAIVLRREGIPAGAPVFIPFLGAFIAMKGRPRDAYVEAKVAIGGPVLGSLGAWAVLASGFVLDRPFLVTLGHTGILLNLFNLIPVSPLDGGRIAGAFTRGFWIAGYALGVVALVVTRSPILFLVLLVGLFTLWRRWRNPVPGYDHIPGPKRAVMGLAFAVLVIALALTLPLGMRQHPGIAG